jgi:hypothetical protein
MRPVLANAGDAMPIDEPVPADVRNFYKVEL